MDRNTKIEIKLGKTVHPSPSNQPKMNYIPPVVSPVTSNKFANDGSFLEMFKKIQEQSSSSIESKDSHATPNTSVKPQLTPSTTTGPIPSGSTQPKPPVCVGQIKRRKVLKVGVIKRQKKVDDDTEEPAKDAWSKYMSEVRKYKEKYGDDSDKNRPLVK